MKRKIKETISLLMFSATDSGHREKLMALASRLGLENRVHLFRSCLEFADRVESSLYGRTIILILLENEEDHLNILNLKDILDGHHVILILPDTEDDVMTRGMSLYPRFVSYLKEDYLDVYAVLEKMINKIENQIKGEEDGASN